MEAYEFFAALELVGLIVMGVMISKSKRKNGDLKAALSALHDGNNRAHDTIEEQSLALLAIKDKAERLADRVAELVTENNSLRRRIACLEDEIERLTADAIETESK